MKKNSLAVVIIIIALIFTTGALAFAQAAPNLTGYFVAVDGQPSGPHNAAGLRQLIDRGQLNRDTLVWREGMPAWLAAGTVAELAPLLPAIPPPLPVAQVSSPLPTVAAPPPIPDQVAPPPIPGEAQQTAVPPPIPLQATRAEHERTWWNSFSPALDSNRVIFNAGIGLGPVGGYSRGIPPISASIAFKVSETLPITVGATGIFSTWTWRYELLWEDLHFTFRNIGLGARIMYHFNFARAIDCYIGLSLGYVFQSLSGNISGFGGHIYSNSFFLWSTIVGARWFFSDSLGIYVEAGASSLQWLSVGLTMKF